MPCNKPQRALRDSDGVRFVGAKTLYNLTLPCRQCWGCRLESSRQWAIRCMHEAKMHQHNSFITLTYNDQNLPQHGSLNYRDFQLFMKRLLRALSRKKYNGLIRRPSGGKIRFYMCGEYGELGRRPHYHACLFGLDFADKIYIGKSGSGSKVYQSTTLENIWQQGFSSIGDVTFESAAYVARYIMKKINGPQKNKHYEQINKQTGEIIELKQEFNQMSRASGIGKTFLDKYWTDIYPEGRVIVRGHPSKTPRYYDKQFEKRDPVAWEALELDRHLYARQHIEDHKPARLKAREQITEAQIQMLKRKI